MTNALTAQQLKKAGGDTRMKGAPLRVVSRMLLDQSGSMRAHAVSLLEGAADYLEMMREQTLTTVVAFDLFNEDFDAGASALAMQTPYLTEERYEAEGDTALYDSILKTISMAAREERPTDRVLISIFTDGHDTCSLAGIGDVKREVLARQLAGWTFVFGGPNLQAGTDLGIPKDNVFALNSMNVRGVLEKMIRRTVTLLLPERAASIQL